MAEGGALITNRNYELSNLVDSNLLPSFHQEHLAAQAPNPGGIYTVSGYTKLCRILSAVGYEVVIEGKPAEKEALHLGRAHARVDGNNFEVLLESRFETIKFKTKGEGMGLTKGYTYFRLEGPTAYARFIKDYGEITDSPLKSTFFFAWGMLSAMAAGIIAGGMGLIDLAISQSIPWWLYASSFPAGAGTTGKFAKKLETEVYQEKVKQFYDRHREHATSGIELPLIRALHLPGTEKNKDEQR